MEFGANKTPTEVIREGALDGTYFRDIHPGINRNQYRNFQKKSDQLRNIDQKYYCSSYYDCSANKYVVKCGTSLRFRENKGQINEIDTYSQFQQDVRYCLGRGSQDDESQIRSWRKILSRFRGKLIKMIKDAGNKFDDSSISSNIRHILQYQGYELTEKYFFY